MSLIAKLIKILFSLVLTFVGLSFFLLNDSSPILIESKESKTIMGKPVYNKIYLKTEGKKDIWLMEQSHSGLNALKKEWDKIAIIVDKEKKPYKAKFFQLMPGKELISMNLKPIDLKVSCYMCHSNGPRAIRPNNFSKTVKLSAWDKARVLAWNLKIKTYGPIESSAFSINNEFKIQHPQANIRIDTKTCNKCHNKESMFGRNELTRQNFPAVKFMIKNKLMPPPGFSMEKEEREKLLSFLGIKD